MCEHIVSRDAMSMFVLADRLLQERKVKVSRIREPQPSQEQTSR